jgi:hypothetical protein
MEGSGIIHGSIIEKINYNFNNFLSEQRNTTQCELSTVAVLGTRLQRG